jgi:hydroxyacylglutathione hydrolase
MQITPHIHMLTIPFAVPLPSGPLPRSVNVFLVLGETVLLVDSGVAGAEQRIFAYLRELGRRPEEIAMLILTHSHPDHVGAAVAVKLATGCTVFAHTEERSWIEDTELQLRERPVPGFRELVGGPVAVDRLLAEGDRFELGGGVTLEVLPTPGHSAGSISLWDRRAGVLITGDAVPLPGDMPIFDDLAASLASLERLRSCGAEWLLSAWGEPVRGDGVGRLLGESKEWLKRIRETVRSTAGDGTAADVLELSRRVVAQLGLPAAAANPLTARSFLACLEN